MRVLFFLPFLFCLHITKAQVPKLGNDTLLDIACWNTEWLGNTSNGPSDEQLQYDNVKLVMNNTDIDVWGLCEVSDNTTYTNLVNQLPRYQSVISTFSQTQKTALFYRSSMFDIISTQQVLTESQYNYDFAGRTPLEVVLKTKNAAVIDTIYFYVVHLKAISEQESYNRRKNAAAHLKTFLEVNRAGKKTVVIGDWNDDLDIATFGSLETPFKNFLSDTARYFFTTYPLSLAGKKSYAFINGSMIDHQLISKPLKSFYVEGSSVVLDQMPTFISNFSNNTSDHYPVLSFFNLKRYTSNVSIDENRLLPVELFISPDGNYLYIRNVILKELMLRDITGKRFTVPVSLSNQQAEADLTGLPQGVYITEIDNGENRVVKKLVRLGIK